MSNLAQLQERRAELAKKIRDLADRQDEWTAEDRQTWDVLNKDYDANLTELNAAREKAEAEAREREAIQRRLEEVNSYRDFLPKSNRRLGRDGASLREATTGLVENRWNLALQGWLRSAGPGRGEVTQAHLEAATACGIDLRWDELRLKLPSDFSALRGEYNISRSVRNALSSNVGAQGGFTFGESFVNDLEVAMLAYGTLFNVADVIRTTTAEPMRWPTANDTTNSGRQIGESGPVNTNVDPSFGQITWSAYKFTSDMILVPYELLRDNAVNLVQHLARMLGERLGRIQNNRYTVGNGASTPKGIVTCATAGVTTASATAITFDEVIDLEHSVDPSRRRMPGVGYMFHDNVFKAIRKLKDAQGQYLWQAGANSGAPDTLNTYPYAINQDMSSTISAGAVTMLFGDLSAYKIRQVNEIRLYRLTERYRDNDQDGFVAFIEGDGNLLDAGDGPVRKMTQAT